AVFSPSLFTRGFPHPPPILCLDEIVVIEWADGWNRTGQNPSGASMFLERRKELYSIFQKHDILIIEDDPYCISPLSSLLLPSSLPSLPSLSILSLLRPLISSPRTISATFMVGI